MIRDCRQLPQSDGPRGTDGWTAVSPPAMRTAKRGDTMGRLNAGVIPVTPFQQNCTILYDSETLAGVVVDPGGEADRIAAVIREQRFAIEAIWITHGHIDHAGGAMDLKDTLGVEILGPHVDDKPLLDNLEIQAVRFGLDGRVRNCIPDRFLAEGDVVAFGEHSFSVLHCPGHAPGHVVFYNAAARFAHVGDVLFQGSVGRTDLPGGDHASLIRSIKDKLLPLGDEVGFICGHGPGGRFGDERRTNPFLA
jgi:glyoxylase-like metal-dependent hydrolase (beta-lactamase superfamily II)